MASLLPSSPNWYCGDAVAAADAGVIFYGARGDINILQLLSHSRSHSQSLNGDGVLSQSQNSAPLSEVCSGYTDCVLISTMTKVHKDRISVVLVQPDDGGSGKLPTGDSVEENSRSGEQSSNKEGLAQSKNTYAYLLFTAAEDGGKIRQHRISWKRNEGSSQVTDFCSCLKTEQHQIPKGVSLKFK